MLKKSCFNIIVGQVGSSKLMILLELGDKLKHSISKIKTKESSASRLLHQTCRFGTCSMIKRYAVANYFSSYLYQPAMTERSPKQKAHARAWNANNLTQSDASEHLPNNLKNRFTRFMSLLPVRSPV